MKPIYLALVLLSSVVHASGPACQPMPGGPYKGQCQDTHEKLAAHAMTASETAPFGQAEAGVTYVGNVAHFGHFYVARVKPAELEYVAVQVEHFAPELVAAHCQLRLHFSSDVELSPQDKEDKGALSAVRTRDLIFSAEYSAPAGVPFDLVKGLSDFAIVHRMMTLESKRAYMIDKQHHTVNQYRLALLRGEREAVWSNALAVADAEGMHVMYHTLQHSCVTEMFRVIDLSLDQHARWKLAPWYVKMDRILGAPRRAAMRELYDRMPVWTLRGLKSRGLIDKASSLPNLNDE